MKKAKKTKRRMPRKVPSEIVARREKVAILWGMHITEEAIAIKLQCSRAAIHRDIMALRREFMDRSVEAMEPRYARALATTEAVISRGAKLLASNDAMDVHRGGDMALKGIQQLANMLGWNAPQGIALQHSGMVAVEDGRPDKLELAKDLVRALRASTAQSGAIVALADNAEDKK